MRHLVIAVAVLLQYTTADVITQASNRFAAELYHELAKTPGNVLVCPVSAHIALALVHQGATGDTQTELGRYLYLQGDNQQIKTSYMNMLHGLKGDVLKIATSLFPAISFTPKADYVSVAKQYFLSDVQPLDYGKPVDAAKIINNFVEKETNNKIHDIIKPDSLSDLTRLVIVNAVHFKADWVKPFPPAFTDTFKVTPSQKVQTQFLGQTDNFFYNNDDKLDAKILRMDYEKGEYSMVFVLPNQENGLTDLETKLATTSMDYILKNLKDVRVEVTIPKFKIEQEIQLKEVLMKLGIVKIFDSKAELSGITDRESLAVDSVIQKTFIDVNEKGTEAAAATGVVTPLSGGSEENTFAAKKPFIFYLIHNKPIEVILFSGRLAKPEKTENTPQKHATDTTHKEEGNANSSEEEGIANKLGIEQGFVNHNYGNSESHEGQHVEYHSHTGNSQQNSNRKQGQQGPLSTIPKNPHASLPPGQQGPNNPHLSQQPGQTGPLTNNPYQSQQQGSPTYMHQSQQPGQQGPQTNNLYQPQQPGPLTNNPYQPQKLGQQWAQTTNPQPSQQPGSPTYMHQPQQPGQQGPQTNNLYQPQQPGPQTNNLYQGQQRHPPTHSFALVSGYGHHAYNQGSDYYYESQNSNPHLRYYKSG